MDVIFGTLAVPCLICLIIGIVLFIVEMFTPGFGVAGVLGFISFIAVIVMQFVGNNDIRAALWTSAVLLAIMTALFIWFVHSFQSGKLSKSRIVLQENIEGESTSLSNERFQELIGKEGTTLTPLRPAGIALIDGERQNVQTAGEFIPAEHSITVVAVENLRIIVK